VDELDSRVNSWLGLMAREGGSRRWTSADNVYEQPIWRGALPTVQAEKRAPPAELMTPVIYVPREGGAGGGPQRKPGQGAKPKEKRRAPRPAAASAEARPEGAAAEAKAEGAPAHEPRPPRPDRPPRADRPDRGPREHRGGPGGPGGPAGFGDKKRGYQGPRLPGDTGPHRPSERKSLTHNPFAALAAKLEGAGAAEEPKPPVEGAPPAEPPPPEAAPETAAASPAEPPVAETKPTEGA
jgi:3'-5' exoribonuclease